MREEQLAVDKYLRLKENVRELNVVLSALREQLKSHGARVIDGRLNVVERKSKKGRIDESRLIKKFGLTEEELDSVRDNPQEWLEIRVIKETSTNPNHSQKRDHPAPPQTWNQCTVQTEIVENYFGEELERERLLRDLFIQEQRERTIKRIENNFREALEQKIEEWEVELDEEIRDSEEQVEDLKYEIEQAETDVYNSDIVRAAACEDWFYDDSTDYEQLYNEESLSDLRTELYALEANEEELRLSRSEELFRRQSVMEQYFKELRDLLEQGAIEPYDRSTDAWVAEFERRLRPLLGIYLETLGISKEEWVGSLIKYLRNISLH